METSVSGCSSSPARELGTAHSPTPPEGALCCCWGRRPRWGWSGWTSSGRATSRPRPTPQSVLGPGASPGKQSLAHPALSQSLQQHGAHSRGSEGCHPWTASVCDALRNPGPVQRPAMAQTSGCLPFMPVRILFLNLLRRRHFLGMCSGGATPARDSTPLPQACRRSQPAQWPSVASAPPFLTLSGAAEFLEAPLQPTRAGALPGRAF